MIKVIFKYLHEIKVSNNANWFKGQNKCIKINKDYTLEVFQND